MRIEATPTTTASTVALDPVRESARLPPGSFVDRYMVLEELGRGGMGTVFHAYDPKLDRRVALKLHHIQAAEGAQLARREARLYREAKALAQIAHPNVISVYDVGTFEGQLFIAMEFVEGKTLRTWLDSDKPSRAQILEVFLAAGQGLAVAHAAGLMHRDFKPGNVVIGNDGRVRVLDFGLARAFDFEPRSDTSPVRSERNDAPSSSPASSSRQDAAPDSELDTEPDPEVDREPAPEPPPRGLEAITPPDAVIGTPAYMAPEQRGGHADHRADQFSYCVALFEALCGQRPFSTEQRRQFEQGQGALEVTIPDQARVPSWLGRILVRGLSTDPAQRYPSMKALLDDLRRDPLRTRRRVAVALLVTAIAASVAFAVVSRSAVAPPCEAARTHLRGVWDDDVRKRVERSFLATGRAYAADTFARVATALDTFSDKWVAMYTEACRATRVHGEQSESLLDLRMTCLSKHLDSMGALTSVFAEHADAQVVDKAALAVIGLPTIDECADADALTRAYPPPQDPKLREAVAAVEHTLDRSDALRAAGSFDKARELATGAVERASELEYPPLQARAALALGELQDSGGDAKAAEATLYEAARLGAVARDDRRVAGAWIDLVWVVGYMEGRYDDGLAIRPMAETAVARAGDDELLQAALLSNLGVLYDLTGKSDRAREDFERALALQESVLGKEHPELAPTIYRLGIARWRQGDYEAAQSLHQRSISILERAVGPDHPDIAPALDNLAISLGAQGKFDEAIAYSERALAIEEAAFGNTHARVAATLENLGESYRGKGDVETARRYLERALAIEEAAFGPTHPQVGLTCTGLGGVLVELGRYQEGLEMLERALAIATATFGDHHPALVSILTELAASHLGLGRTKKAVGLAERARAIVDESGDDSGLRRLQFVLAQALWQLGKDRTRAGRLVVQAREGYVNAGPADARQVAAIDEWIRARGL